jgi:hypothetical protein
VCLADGTKFEVGAEFAGRLGFIVAVEVESAIRVETAVIEGAPVGLDTAVDVELAVGPGATVDGDVVVGADDAAVAGVICGFLSSFSYSSLSILSCRSNHRVASQTNTRVIAIANTSLLAA